MRFYRALIVCIMFGTSFVFPKKISNDLLGNIQRAIPADAVVLIYAQHAEFDWLQPYRTPKQLLLAGTGFFIDQEGYIVTNAHVVNQSVALWVQISSLGRMPLRVDLIGMYPERDIALLKLDDESLARIKKECGSIKVLEMGDSDNVIPGDKAFAWGYPLQDSLKCTRGVISGRQTLHGHNYIQMDTTIHSGSSGGPLLDKYDRIIGINTCGFPEFPNINFAIPINDLRMVLGSLKDENLLRKPFVGLWSIKATDELAEHLGNPVPAGSYIAVVVKNSPLEKAGILVGDMLYEIDGQRVDECGEIAVSWSQDRVSVVDYLSRIPVGTDVEFVVYRNGERLPHMVRIEYSDSCCAIRQIYPWIEEIDYEAFGGLVVMPLTHNHIALLHDSIPALARYARSSFVGEPRLIITHVFANSFVSFTRVISAGYTISKVNGVPVGTLEEYRAEIKKGAHKKFLVLTVCDELNDGAYEVPIALPYEKIVKETFELTKLYHYPISETTKEIAEILK